MISMASVLLDVLPVLVERGRADSLDLPPAESRLEHVGRVDGALGRSRPDQGVELVQEEDHVLGLADLLHHRLEALLELAAILRACHERAEVKLQQALIDEHVGHVVVDDLLGQPLDDGRLAHAGLPDEDGVVLRPPGEHLDDALDLHLPADDGVELSFARQLREIPRELVQDGGLGALLGAGVVLVAQEGQRFLAHLLQPRAQRLEDLGGDALPLLHEAEEQVLGADVVVAELARFFDRKLEDPFGLRGEGNLPEGEGLGKAGEGAFDLSLHGLETEPEPLEDGGGDPFPVPDEAQEDVLRADEIVTEAPRFLSGQDDDPPRPFRKSLEHWSLLPGFARVFLPRQRFSQIISQGGGPS